MKLLCGDCLELINDILDNSIDLIATDPPYKMTSRGSKRFIRWYVFKRYS